MFMLYMHVLTIQDLKEFVYWVHTSLLVPVMSITKLSNVICISILLSKIIIGAEHHAITILTK